MQWKLYTFVGENTLKLGFLQDTVDSKISHPEKTAKGDVPWSGQKVTYFVPG